MTNPTPHGQVPAIQRYKIGYHSDEWGMRSSSPSSIPDTSGPWVRYADHVAQVEALNAAQAGVQAGYVLVPLEPTVHQEAAGRDASYRCSTLGEACKIYKAMLAAAPQPSPTAQAAPAAGAVAGPDDYTPLLDDEGRMMVGTSHHYTAENIRALVAEYKALEAGGPDTWELHYNTDHSARAGVLWRVISALADEVPFAAAAQAADSVQEDAARLDFLIEQRAYVVSDPDTCPGYWLHFVHKETGKCWVQCDEHPTPRAAIDAAMKAGGAT